MDKRNTRIKCNITKLSGNVQPLLDLMRRSTYKLVEESHELEARKEYREMIGRRNPRPNRSMDQCPITSRELFTSLLEATQVKPTLSSNSFFCLMPSTNCVGGADQEGEEDIEMRNVEEEPALEHSARASSSADPEEEQRDVPEEGGSELADGDSAFSYVGCSDSDYYYSIIHQDHSRPIEDDASNVGIVGNDSSQESEVLMGMDTCRGVHCWRTCSRSRT